MSKGKEEAEMGGGGGVMAAVYEGSDTEMHGTAYVQECAF